MNQKEVFFVDDRQVYLFEDVNYKNNTYDFVTEEISDKYDAPEAMVIDNRNGYVEIDSAYQGVIFLDGGEYYPNLESFKEEYPTIESKKIKKHTKRGIELGG